MAQTGYTPILLYSSSTAAQTPTAASLTNSSLGSELAINITDGKLFYKDNAGVVQTIGWKVVPTSAGGTGLTTYNSGDMLYYVAGSTFNKLAIGSVNYVLTSTGTIPTWSNSLVLVSLSLSSNLTFTSGSNRILGDFTNATLVNRVYFQTSTTNGNTLIGAIPNGTATTSEFAAYSAAAPTNSTSARLIASSTESSIQSSINGTGSYVPLTFYTSNAERVHIATGGGVLFRQAANAANNSVVFDTTTQDAMTLDSNGRLGIGVTSPDQELHVVGQGYFTGGVVIGTNSTSKQIDDSSNGSSSSTLYIGNASITTSSDRRLKRNIKNTEVDALEKVKALRVVDFVWDDPSDTSWNNKNARGQWTGLIAQEAIEQVPWAVNAPRDEKTLEPLPDAKDKDGNDEYWFMEYEQLVPMIIKGMQQQQAQIDALKAKVLALLGG